jgi:OmpA-OmpF porin, OOP family
MASKKITILMAFALGIMQTATNAQPKDLLGLSWSDTSKIAGKNKAQFNAFQDNSYPFPARPKDMWELGVGIGVATMSGDLRNDPGLGVTVTARKSLSHIFSLRPFYQYSKMSGNADINQDTRNIAYDFTTVVHQIGIDGMVSLNTLRTYKGNPKFNMWMGTGFGFCAVNVTQNKGGVESQYYSSNYNQFGTFGEKNAQGLGPWSLVPCWNLLAGFAYKLTTRVNVGLEFKNSLTNNDYLDAYTSVYSNAFDAMWLAVLKLNVNLGNSSKRVEPLWWLNPNQYVYNELNQPNHLKNKLKMKLDDADGDGITDQFDLEPNSPKGVNVDSHGRAIDTDGDGIPDYKDKEPLTQSKCYPVDNDGVGKCPEANCCKESQEKITELQKQIDDIKKNGTSGGDAGACSISNLPSINFKSGGSNLNRDLMKLLDAVAAQMKNNGGCKVKVLGHPEANKSSQQKAYDRVESIIKYLVEKQGISESRFIFAYDAGSGDGNTIDLQGTTEEGPNTVPAPAPHLKGKQNF